MSEPEILKLKKELEKRKANMTIFNAETHTYNHTGGNAYLEEPLVLSKCYDNSNGYLEYITNGIKIGAGVKHINVKANALVRLAQNNQSTDIYITIRKNEEKFAESNFFQQGLGPGSYSLYSEYMEVQEGDIIQLFLAGSNADINVLDGGGSLRQTQLTVEVAD